MPSDMGTFRIDIEIENPARPGARRRLSSVLVDTGAELSCGVEGERRWADGAGGGVATCERDGDERGNEGSLHCCLLLQGQRCVVILLRFPLIFGVHVWRLARCAGFGGSECRPCSNPLG
jgi:hypothetical protein